MIWMIVIQNSLFILKMTYNSILQFQDRKNDCYCWICHEDGEVICCETCPRVFHLKCFQSEATPGRGWVCPECVLIMSAETKNTRWIRTRGIFEIILSKLYRQVRFHIGIFLFLKLRSPTMRLLSVNQLSTLLNYALTRIRNVSNVDPFTRPVDPKDFPAYRDYVIYPMDLFTIQKKVEQKQ